MVGDLTLENIAGPSAVAGGTVAIRTIASVDDVTWLAITSAGTVIRSSNGGASFSVVADARALTGNGTVYGFCISIADNGIDCVATFVNGSTFGRVLVSRDAGVTWAVMPAQPNGGTLRSPTFWMNIDFDHGGGIVAGIPGSAYSVQAYWRSTDWGATWQALAVPQSTFDVNPQNTARANGRTFFMGARRVISTADFTTYDVSSSDLPRPVCQDVRFRDGVYFVLYSSGSITGGGLATSSDLATFTTRYDFSDGFAARLSYSPTTGLFYASNPTPSPDRVFTFTPASLGVSPTDAWSTLMAGQSATVIGPIFTLERR
jgi:hypothetical protein